MSGVEGRSGPPGNQNAHKARLWRDALHRALEKRGNGDKIKALDELAEKFLDTVEVIGQGKTPSIAGYGELGDRLDGRPTQALEHSGPEGEPLRLVIEK